MTRSLAELERETAARLAAAGVPSPDHDAIALLALAMSAEPGAIRTAMARGDEVPSGFDDAAFEAIVARRLEREPLQHITGRAPFRNLDLEVGPGVFVPRPETELVAQAAIDALERMGPGELLAADLCSGSGAIALAVVTETPARVWAVELDTRAVPYLERNAAVLPADAQARLSILQGDGRTALADLDGTLDVVVSNPPYIPGDARPKDPEVELYDPQLSLYGLGPDGLEVPRGIMAAAARLLRPGGVIVMEHGAPQAAAVRLELEKLGAFDSITTHTDLVGWDRFATARRKAS